MKKIVVHVDPDLADLMPGFLANKRRDAILLMEAADGADFTKMREIGHRIRGEGGSYGFEGITTIGQAIEEAAARQELAVSRRQIDALTAYLDSIELVFE
jgi:HPt (histidine-containing phosphotransfer) domain-containing protein